MTSSKLSPSGAKAVREALVSSFPNQWDLMSKQWTTARGRYFFHIIVNGELCVTALYDIGAEVTLMRDKVYRKWVGRKDFPAVPSHDLSSAFGHSSQDTLLTHIPLAAMGKQYTCPVYVVPQLSCDFIAGSDFIKKFKMSLDVIREKIVTDETIEVHAVHSEQLGPYESKMVEVQLHPRSGIIPSNVVIESTSDSQLLIPPVLARDVNPDGKVKVPLWNYGPNPMDTREVCSVVGRATAVDKAIPVKDLLIGELDMPQLTKVDKEKGDYLMKHLKVGKMADSDQEARFRNLVLKYHQAFGAHPFDLGRTQSHQHEIILKNPNQVPVFTKQFRLPQADREIVIENVEKMLKLGIVRPCSSPWNSSCFLVPKKDKGHRLVVDLRGVNEACVDQLHCGQDIEDLIACVGRLEADTFSNLDILKGFWQIGLKDKASEEKCAFTIPGYGQFCYTVTPMGLQGSVYAFWALVNALTFKLDASHAYMDDILTASKGGDDHLRDLEKLFRRVIQHKLTLNVEKCDFFQKELQFLGFEVGGEGVRPGKPKVELLQKCPPCESVTQVKQFLGLGNFFYRFYPFQKEAKHLSVLTRKDSKWKGGPLPPRALQAFNNIKKMLVSRPLLRYPDYSKPFHIFTDAATGTANQVDVNVNTTSTASGLRSEEVQPGGIGAFLGQEDDKGQMYALGWAGRGLKKHEVAYSTYLCEHLGACFGLESFDYITRRCKVYLHVDHQPITHLQNMSSTHKRTLLRLQEIILQRNVEIVYTPGSLNSVADFLSRHAYRVEAVEKQNPAPEESIVLHMLPYSRQEIQTLQRADPEVFELIQYLKGKKTTPEGRRWGPKCFFGSDGVLYYRLQPNKKYEPMVNVVLPKVLRKEVMRAAHESCFAGHGGVFKTQELVRQQFFWGSLLQDVAQYVLSCDRCQKHKKSNYTGVNPLAEVPTERKFNDQIHIDLFGPIKSASPCKFIMTITDCFTRWSELVACRNKTAEEIAEKLYNVWICRHSCPVVISSDCGGEFKNKILQNLEARLGIEGKFTSGWNPKANGIAEAVNKSIARYIKSLLDLNVDDIEDWLPSLQSSYNFSIHRSHRFSPYEILYSQKPRWPWFDPHDIDEMFYGEMTTDDLLKRTAITRKCALENSLDFKQAYTHSFNKDKTMLRLEKGDLVLLHAPLMTKRDLNIQSEKFNIPWVGPLKVKDIYPKTHNALVKFPPFGKRANKEIRVHQDRLKKYILREGTKSPFDPDFRQDTRPAEEVEVEEALQEPPQVSGDHPWLVSPDEVDIDYDMWEERHQEPDHKKSFPDHKVHFDPVSPPITLPAPPTPEQMERNRVPNPVQDLGQGRPVPLPAPDRPFTRSLVQRQPGLRSFLVKPQSLLQRRATRKK